MQPINNVTRIGTREKDQNSSKNNFNHLYKTMIDQNSKVYNQNEKESVNELKDEVNYYSADAKATYYSANKSKNSYYS